MESEHKEGKPGIQSLETGIDLLRIIVSAQKPMMLKEIAEKSGMVAGKAHRYLVSLVRTGMIEQDASSLRYSPGHLALEIGVTSIDRADRIKLGSQAIARLRDRINQAVALATWGKDAPVIVRWERPHRPLTVNVMTGTSLGILTSASGRVFAAYLPEARTKRQILLELEAADFPHPQRSLQSARALLDTIRCAGFSAISGDYIFPGIEAVAAPVFNAQGQITLSLTVVGVQGTLDLDERGTLIPELLSSAADLSRHLGCSAPSQSTD